MYFTLIILDNNVETMCFRVPLNPNSPMLDVKRLTIESRKETIITAAH